MPAAIASTFFTAPPSATPSTSCVQYGRNMPAASEAARSRPMFGSKVAMLIAVGRPRTASSAKLGPDSNARGRPG
jgi:hypothetical protein